MLKSFFFFKKSFFQQISQKILLRFSHSQKEKKTEKAMLFLTAISSLTQLFGVSTRNSCHYSRPGMGQCPSQVATMDKPVEYSLIQTFRMLKQIIWSLCHLFPKNKFLLSRTLPSTQLFPWSHDSSSYRKFTVELFRGISSLSNN